MWANRSGSSSVASRASAKTVFFIVSVGSTSVLMPSVCADSNRPSSRTWMVQSWIRCRDSSRTSLTSRIAALPYALLVSRALTSAPPISGVPVGTEQERYMVRPAGVPHLEFHFHLGEERFDALARKPGSGVEHQAVPPRGHRDSLGQKRRGPPVGVGGIPSEHSPLAVSFLTQQRHRQAGRGPASGSIQHVGRDSAHVEPAPWSEKSRRSRC